MSGFSSQESPAARMQLVPETSVSTGPGGSVGRKEKFKNCLVSNQAVSPLKFLELTLQIVDNLGMRGADNLRIRSRDACGTQRSR
jgi:hypothetical protein